MKSLNEIKLDSKIFSLTEEMFFAHR